MKFEKRLDGERDRLDFYMYPETSPLIDGEVTNNLSFLMFFSALPGYKSGDNLPDLNMLIKTASYLDTALIVEWSKKDDGQNGRIESSLKVETMVDTDLDGRPDDCGPICVGLGMVADTDNDGDGVLDAADAYPLIALGAHRHR